ncbi:response regulator transcription factor [Paracraurococcus lichenis]|uniref:Response regulator transcription factor n=1 Tax=Paracraurococcus lichenis TaxID=3064888 RepID=A0ABT9DUU6_9PROT|nr:response regulator transcription factor [Paracraurococcus sp. LOR1-02]MDO9707653.1 response regulator transcription factor [Paracraurococcus sp. LOR1-02]
MPQSPLARPLLIVEDDQVLCSTLAEQLSLDGEFEATAAGSVAAAEALLGAPDAGFDAILLDVGLPDGDGRELCQRLRRRGLRMPILMLTGRDGEQDVVHGLEAGANDYLAKPFRRGELLARVRAQLRIFDNTEDAVFTIGHYTFRPAARIMLDRLRNRKVRLTDKECRILKYLYRARGQVVERRELLDQVWGYSSSVTTHTLETHIYRLRQKIEPNPSRVRLLLTEAGGYRLEPRPEGVAAEA